jgi:hypothetical protein
MPISVFYSYSHRDEAFRDELEKRLAPLGRSGIITGWHDRRIVPGTEWDGEIERKLASAEIILLLISPEFLDSDYCWKEMETAMERQRTGLAVVLPIILRPVQLKHLPFGALQSLPENARPVSKWEDRDDAWLNVSEGIEQAIDQLRAARESISSETAPGDTYLAGSVSPAAEYHLLVLTTDKSLAQTIYSEILHRTNAYPLDRPSAYDMGELHGWNCNLIVELSKKELEEVITDIAAPSGIDVLIHKVDSFEVAMRQNLL